MVGRCFGLFSGAVAVSFREGNSLMENQFSQHPNQSLQHPFLHKTCQSNQRWHLLISCWCFQPTHFDKDITVKAGNHFLKIFWATKISRVVQTTSRFLWQTKHTKNKVAMVRDVVQIYQHGIGLQKFKQNPCCRVIKNNRQSLIVDFLGSNFM